MRPLLFLILFFLCLDAEAQQNDQQPATLWKFKTGGPIFSSPVIDEQTVYVGSNDSNLYSIDVLTGNVNWKFRTGGEIRSTVSLRGNIVFLVSGDGACYALDKQTARVVWKFTTRGEKKYELFSFADYYQSTPVYDQEMIYFGSGDGYIYALNALTGNKVWEYKTGSVVHGTPVVAEGKVFAGSFDGYMYALDVRTGKEVWKFKSVGQSFFPKGEMQGSTGYAGGIVFIGSRDYNLYAIDAKQGYCHWNKRFLRGWAMGIPSVFKNVLYVGTSDDYEMHAIEPKSGRTLWKTNTQFNIFGGMAFNDSIGYFGNLMGRLFAVSLKNGAVKWNYATEGSKANHGQYFKPDNTYRDDIQTIIKANEDFYTLYLKMGAIFSTPAVTKDHIVISSLDGYVQCLKNR